MSAVDKILAVLASKLLMPELTMIPGRGATDFEIQEEQSLLSRAFCSDHIAILQQWNGISLEVIRLFGCGSDAYKVGRLSAMQIKYDFLVNGAIVVGSDPSGFLYIQSSNMRVFSFDTDGGEFKQLAENLDDFLERYIFGIDAALFAGEEWLAELHSAGIVS